MGKVIDLSEKLSFDEKPEIHINDTVISVNDDAKTVLEIMGLSNTGDEIEMVQKGIGLLFNKSELKKLDALHLNFKDYTEVFRTAMSLATGVDESELEEQEGEETPHTTT